MLAVVDGEVQLPAGTFVDVLGIRLERVGPHEVVVSMDVKPHHLQPYGIVHGGVWCALVESAASLGAATWFGGRGKVVGVANHTDFLRSAGEGATVTATATPIHRGRLQQLWLVEVHDGEDRLVARGQLRLQNLADP